MLKKICLSLADDTILQPEATVNTTAPQDLNYRYLTTCEPHEVRAILNADNRRRRKLQTEQPKIFVVGHEEPYTDGEVLAAIATLSEAITGDLVLPHLRTLLGRLRPEAKLYSYRGFSRGGAPAGAMTVIERRNEIGVTFLQSRVTAGGVVDVDGVPCLVLSNGFSNKGNYFFHWMALQPCKGELPDQPIQSEEITNRHRRIDFTPKEKGMMRLLEHEFEMAGLLRSWISAGKLIEQAQLGCAPPTVKKLLEKLIDGGLLQSTRDPRFGVCYKATPEARVILRRLDYKE